MREFFLTKITAWVWVVVVMRAEAHSGIAKPGCQDECGGVKIPFPFGIGDDCYITDVFNSGYPTLGYEIVCNGTADNRKPLLSIVGNREVLNISLQDQTVTISSEIAYDCVGTGESVPSSNPNVRYGSPIDISMMLGISGLRNRLTTIGCGIVATLGEYPDTLGESGSITAECTSSCSDDKGVPIDGDCVSFIGCCDSSISSYVGTIEVPVLEVTRASNTSGTCGYAFVAETGWYNFSVSNLSASAKECYNIRVPLVFDWVWNLANVAAINCSTSNSENTTCSSNSKASCYAPACQCLEGYSGNPYLRNGCQDVNECVEEEWRMNTNCEKREYCVNKEGGYDCRCPTGYLGDGTTTSPCLAVPAPVHAPGYTKLIVGVSIGMGSMICFIALYVLHKLIRRKKETKEKEFNFKRNGGLLLEQQISTNEGGIDRTRIFTRIELEKATNNFNDNRVLGSGGQGTVYKGMLVDGTIIAVKKSKKVDDNQLAPFINEVVILSQINHRNVVKLFGCCLETHVPLLVYEFVPNGTLYQHIHNPSEDFHMTWKVRLQIAMECAKAIAYLHSSCSSPIYHRDIKSSNILLDEKYKAKVSDFGTSRTISIDKTHVTTDVQGTFGYLDPEFFRSSQFNEKSDVYSFGVVLLELLTSMKPIFLNSSREPRGLAIEFIQIMETRPNQLHEILDAQVLQHCLEEEIHQLTKLIERCLSVIGKQRPTMTEVAMTLEMIKSQQDKKANHVVEKERHIWIHESSTTNEDTSIGSSIGLPR